MADDIFELQRTSTDTTGPGGCVVLDNRITGRGNAEVENRGFAASSTSEACEQENTLLDVSQVAEYLRVSRSSVYKLIER